MFAFVYLKFLFDFVNKKASCLNYAIIYDKQI